jgi:anaerobic magnesium-protoporphyrin IX monomethyl ester cyclase
LLIINKERAYKIADALKPLKLKWQCQGRVNVVDRDLLRHMKDAGCVTIGFGIESGSQTILNSMNKKIDVRESARAVTLAYECGIHPHIQMIYGYIGENQETVLETMEFFKKIRSNHGGFFVATPLPCTQLMQYAKEKGFITDEEEYLTHLENGYLPQNTFAYNFSEFPDEAFLKEKKLMERTIQDNYRKDMCTLGGAAVRLTRYYRKYGIANGLRLLTQKLKVKAQ